MTDVSEGLARLEERRMLPLLFYAGAAAVLALTFTDTTWASRYLAGWEIALLLVFAVPGGLLFFISLTDLLSYFLFIPSVKNDAHIFSRVHFTYMIHPLSFAVLLVLAALCIHAGMILPWIVWCAMLGVFAFHTSLIVAQVRRDSLVKDMAAADPGLLFLLIHLLLGTELVTVAAGAKPLAPWKVRDLPEDTWIVDVRTKSEFSWNRLQGAENFPWGAGVVEAARERPKDRPVLVACLSGHRSPTVSVLLKKLGFAEVYNLNWGLLYLVLLERGTKREGPFALTRSHRDPDRRGRDYKAISIGYVVLEVLSLIIAPVEHAYRQVQVPMIQQIIGGLLGLGGLGAALLSFKALGRNFRVFAAPRLSGTLVTTGIYAHIRHPMYIAVIVMFLGYLLFFGSLVNIPLWIGITVLYAVKAVKEEGVLAERFPEYEEYKRRTWRFFPPF